MDPNVRALVLGVGLVFCCLFAAMTVAVALEYGFDVFTVAAIVILLLIVPPLIGAMRGPPR